MTVEVKPNFILVSDIIDNQLVKKKYIGYDVDEAKELFENEFLEKSESEQGDRDTNQ